MTEQINSWKLNFKFLDIVENEYASEDNQTRIGYYIKSGKGWIERINEKGEITRTRYESDHKLKIIGNLISQEKEKWVEEKKKLISKMIDFEVEKLNGHFVRKEDIINLLKK